MEQTEGVLHPLGVLEENEEDLEGVPIFSRASNSARGVILAPLPASVDLTDMFPMAGYQGSQGSCVAWAVAYAARTYQENVEWNWNVYDESNQFSPSWLYNVLHRLTPDKEGLAISTALNAVCTIGCDTLDNFPYNESNDTRLPDAASIDRASRYKALMWGRIASKVEDVKAVLAAKQPVIISIVVAADLENLSRDNPVYDSIDKKTIRGYHALCLVGYDDKRQAFKFINSWGWGWGIEGCGWLSYKLVTDSPVSEDTSKLENIVWSHFKAYYLLDSTHTITNPDGTVSLRQLYLPGATDSFYTTSPDEAMVSIMKLSAIDAGVACKIWTNDDDGRVPFYRFVSTFFGDHYYSTNKAEIQSLYPYYILEGIAGYIYASKAPGTVPLYRTLYTSSSPDADNCFSTDLNAVLRLGAYGYKFVGIAGYVNP